jgi:hypothetical protein
MTARTYRALLVANSTFPADRHSLPDLEGPRNDPALLRDALCDNEVGLFLSDNVRLVTERTMAEVLGEVEDVLVSATQRDTLLLYYSGHGLLDQLGELFLCTRDTRSDRLRSTAVKASDLRAMMDGSAAAATVVILDCCYSGRFKGGDLPATLAGRGRFVVTSSRSGELANDAHVRNHASLFTHHLVEGLTHGAQDRDRDGIVTLSELYDYVHGALAASGRQVPQKRFEGDGDVGLALRSVIGAGPAPTGLVEPALSAPVLDLSETTIDLGEIGHGEKLPPERVAVINRGGGTLDWTAESSADWVQPVAGPGSLTLQLHPRPGHNRANVYVTDASGAVKTLRVTVRVREPQGATTSTRADPSTRLAEAGVTRPDDAQVRPLGESMVPQPAMDDAGSGERRWSFAAVAAAVSSLAGAFAVWSMLRVTAETGRNLLLARPLFAGTILAAASSICGARACIRLVRQQPQDGELELLSWCLGLLMPTAWFLAGHAADARRFNPNGLAAGLAASAAIGMIAAVLVGFALARDRRWHRTTWAPARLVAAGVTATALFGGALLFVNPYHDHRDEPYGGLLHEVNADPWAIAAYILVVVSLVALMHAGLRWLSLPGGLSLTLAVTATPLAFLVSEFTYLSQPGIDTGLSPELAFVVLSTLAVIGTGVAARARARQVVTATGET